jgi:hypothetical protein
VASNSTSNVTLPSGEKLDVFIVKLADGRIVARTAEELARLPLAIRAGAVRVEP